MIKVIIKNAIDPFAVEKVNDGNSINIDKKRKMHKEKKSLAKFRKNLRIDKMVNFGN